MCVQRHGAAVLVSFVRFFESELQAELWARAERARGNLAEAKPDPSLKDVYNIFIGLASLIPIPGVAVAFMASCKIGQMVKSAIDVYQSFKGTAATDILMQLKETVVGLDEWKEKLDELRGVDRAGAVDTLAAAVSSGSGVCHLMILCVAVSTLWL